jgi:acetyl-CoA carboxylase biotin carboxyl carrier protein
MPGKKVVPAKKPSPSAWDIQEIQELFDVLKKNEIREFELEKGGVKIRIKRGNIPAEPSPLPTYSDSEFNLPPSPPPPRPAPDIHHPGSSGGEPGTHESTDGLFIIKSPIVGTFFSSPAPNAPPFVKPGDTVQVAQVLCIIEAMKLMNEIESEVAGEIVRVYVENGQPVEYGQSLFSIRPSHKK